MIDLFGFAYDDIASAIEGHDQWLAVKASVSRLVHLPEKTMRLNKRTKKSREKLADHLMAVANGVSVSLVGGMLVLPMLGIARVAFAAEAPSLALESVLLNVGGHQFEWGMFVLFYLATIGSIMMVRRAAMNIYDKLEGKLGCRTFLGKDEIESDRRAGPS